MDETAESGETADAAGTHGTDADGRVGDGSETGSPGRWPSLATWSLATFDASLFVLLAVLTLHAGGSLSDVLAGLNTVVGVVVFCYLWVLFVLAVRWVRSKVSLASASLGSLAVHGVAAGGVVGITFLLGVLAVAVGPSAVTGSLRPSAVGLIALIGAGVAAVVGSVVGLVAGLVDVAVYRLAGTALREADA